MSALSSHLIECPRVTVLVRVLSTIKMSHSLKKKGFSSLPKFSHPFPLILHLHSRLVLHSTATYKCLHNFSFLHVMSVEVRQVSLCFFFILFLFIISNAVPWHFFQPSPLRFHVISPCRRDLIVRSCFLLFPLSWFQLSDVILFGVSLFHSTHVHISWFSLFSFIDVITRGRRLRRTRVLLPLSWKTTASSSEVSFVRRILKPSKWEVFAAPLLC